MPSQGEVTAVKDEDRRSQGNYTPLLEHKDHARKGSLNSDLVEELEKHTNLSTAVFEDTK